MGPSAVTEGDGGRVVVAAMNLYDGMVLVEAPLVGRLSVILRESLFGWRDASVGAWARRRETFSGLG